MILILLKKILHPIRTWRYISTRQQDNKTNSQWSSQEHILQNIRSVDKSYVNLFGRCPEVEHQVGRYVNMKAIISEIEEGSIPGDVIEFGTWQGLGLILLESAFKLVDSPRKFIGIDSFEGLPESSTVWELGAFSDTSYDKAYANIEKNFGAKNQFLLVKGWFNDERVSEQLYSEIDDICLVHFDADLGSSTRDALKIIEKYLHKISHPVYFLFDDWGCHPDEVPDAFYDWLIHAKKLFDIEAEKLSSTRYTRYYKITTRN
jgi:hypothetical protein